MSRGGGIGSGISALVRRRLVGRLSSLRALVVRLWLGSEEGWTVCGIVYIFGLEIEERGARLGQELYRCGLKGLYE